MTIDPDPGLRLPVNPAPHRVLPRPDRSLPPGYMPSNALPKGYQPQRPDLQVSSTLARQARRTSLSRPQYLLLAVGLALVLSVLMSAVIWLFGGSATLAASGSPDATVRTYFTALSTQDYAHAYDLLSSTAQSAESRTAYINRNLQVDKVGGTITTFTPHQVQTNGTHATMIVDVRRQGFAGRTTIQTILLAQISGKWYIDTITSREQIDGESPASP